MKKIFSTLFLTILLNFSVFAQGNLQLNRLADLNRQIFEAKSFKELNKILNKAEDIYSKDKKRFRNDPEALAKANLDFGIFRKNIKESLLKRLFTPGNSDDELRIFHKIHGKNNKEILNLLGKAIEIYEQELRAENLHLATAKFELAQFYEKYNPPAKGSSGWEAHLKKLSEIQELYSQSLALREKMLEKNDDLILINTYYLANSYLQSADFEKALPYYEKYILEVQEKYGKKSVDLLPALRSSAAIWRMIGRDEIVEKISGQISEITNEKEDLSQEFLPLSARSKSFKYNGINNILGQFSSSKPYGITGDGRVAAADIDSTNSIRGRPQSQTPNFSFIVPGGNSKFKPAKVIKTFITIDTEGNVSDAAAETDDSDIKEKVEKEVKKWEFKPFVYKGKMLEMKGVIYYFLD